MRKILLGSLLAISAGWSALTGAGAPRARFVPAEPRRAPLEPAQRAMLDAATCALSGSLWTRPLAAECRIAAGWGMAQPVSASFGPMLRFSVRAAERVPAVAARAAAWIAREQLELQPANDAEVAQRLATLERGAAAVVRVLRAGSFRQKRDRFAGERRAA